MHYVINPAIIPGVCRLLNSGAIRGLTKVTQDWVIEKDAEEGICRNIEKDQPSLLVGLTGYWESIVMNKIENKAKAINTELLFFFVGPGLILVDLV